MKVPPNNRAVHIPHSREICARVQLRRLRESLDVVACLCAAGLLTAACWECWGIGNLALPFANANVPRAHAAKARNAMTMCAVRQCCSHARER